MDSSQCVSKKQIMIKWKPPEPGWCNMNSDGSALSINGRAGSGGLIRDEHGRWIVGFARNLWLTYGECLKVSA